MGNKNKFSVNQIDVDALSIDATMQSNLGNSTLVLNDITDVVVAGSPPTNQVLTFDGTNWVNATPASGGEDYVDINSSAALPSAGGPDTIAIGANASTNVEGDSIAIGTNAFATRGLCIAIGKDSGVFSGTGNTSSIAIGWGAKTQAGDDISIGTSATTEASYGNISIGDNARTSGSAARSTSIGWTANSDKTNQISIGSGMLATSITLEGGTDVAYSVKIGYGENTVNKNILHLNSKGKLELVGDEAQYILPNYVTGSIPSTTVTGGLIYDTTTSELKVYDAGWNVVGGGGASVALNDLTDVIVAGSPAVSGQVLTFNGTNWINADLTGEPNKNWVAADNGDNFATAPTATGINAIAIGYGADALTTDTIVIGTNANASAAATRSIVIGANSTTTAVKSVNIGFNNVITVAANYQTVVGSYITAASVTNMAKGSAVFGYGFSSSKNLIHIYDEGKLEILGSRAQIVVPKYISTEPANPVEGSLIYDSTLNALKTYDGSTWDRINTSWVNANNSANFVTRPDASGSNAVAIGNNSTAIGTNSVTIGSSADCASIASVVIGNAAETTNGTYKNIVVIGNESSSSSQQSTIVGTDITLDGAGGAKYQTAVGQYIATSSTTSNGIGSAKFGYGFAGANKNLLHLFDKGKLELYGSEAQIIIPKYTTAAPAGNPVEGSLIYDTTANALSSYDGASWNLVSTVVALNDLSDVVVAGSPLVTDQVLTFNGTNWVNADAVSGDANTNWIYANNGVDFPITPVATGTESIAIGQQTSTGANTRAVAIGRIASVSGSNGIAVGTSTIAAASAIAMGISAQANSSNSVAVGANCNIDAAAGSNGNVAMGSSCTISATGDSSICIGYLAQSILEAQVNIGYELRASKIPVPTEYPFSVKLGYGLNSADRNLIHLHSKGKLELVGDEAQFIMPNYSVTGSPIDVPANATEGGLIYDSVAKGLQLYDGTSWAAVGGGGGVENPLTANLDTGGFDIVSADSATTVSSIDIIAGAHTGTVASGEGGNISITGGASDGTGILANGGDLFITGGYSSNTTDGRGGSVSITGGGSGNTGGNVSLNGGDGGTDSPGQAAVVGGEGSSAVAGRSVILGGLSTNASFAGGNVDIYGGNNYEITGGTGGEITITGGYGYTNAGNVTITGGESYEGAGGNVVIEGGRSWQTVAGATIELHSPKNEAGVVEVQFWNDTNTGHTTGFHVTLKAPALTTSRTWTLPDDDPSVVDGHFMQTNSTGVLSFATPASTATPANATASGTAGEVAFDATHIYVCVATDVWVRATLATW